MGMLMLLFHGKHKVLLSLYSPKISLNLLVFDCRWVLQLDSAGSVFYSTAPRWVRQSSGVDLPQYANGSKKLLSFSPCALFLLLHPFKEFPWISSYTMHAELVVYCYL
jgi:hypothetical protein